MYNGSLHKVAGKDCSEYAEDVLAYYGKGTLLTVMFYKDARRLLNFRYENNLEDEVQQYKYHTMYISEDNLVLDLTNSPWETSLKTVVASIRNTNGFGADIKCVCIKGEYVPYFTDGITTIINEATRRGCLVEFM